MNDDRDLKPDNVLPFPSVKEMRESGGPVTRAPRPRDACIHHMHGVLVCPDARQVTCKRCKAVLDPIDAMSKMALHWDWEQTRHAKKQAEAESERLIKEVEKLRRMRSNVRKSGYISVASVKLALEDVIKRLRSNETSLRGSTTRSASSVCGSAANLLEMTRDKLLHGSLETEETV